MARYRGNCNEVGVVAVSFSQAVGVVVHVDNSGDCPVMVQLWGGDGTLETDRRTIRPPSQPARSRAADVTGDEITRITVSCGAGQGACQFDYTVSAT